MISCIMPTANRPEFVAQAVRYFERQSHDERELIILDDGEESAEAAAAGVAGVRHVRLPPGRSLGAKRNLGCELARGEVIAHWDDDDWIGPERLAVQHAALCEGGAAVVGAADLLFYAPLRGEAWRYGRLAEDRPGLCGGTLMYRRAAWEACGFADVAVGEDEAFVAAQAPAGLRAVPADDYYVAVLHRGNTAPKSLRPPRWRQVGLDSVAHLLREDRRFYARLRGGAVETARRAVPGLVMAAPFMVYDGYGSMAEHIALGLEEAGVAVHCAPLVQDRAGLSAGMRRLLDRPAPARMPDTSLIFTFPQPAVARFLAAADPFFYTMWEADRLPPAWAAMLAAARGVVVPSRFLTGVLRDSGVTVPAHVVPLGVDPAVYGPMAREEREGLTTLVVGTMAGRKHVAEAVAAWRMAFEGDAAARLVIKSRFGQGRLETDDPRISFESSELRTRGIAGHYAAADVLLALGNEGFGLPAVEAMACGLPVVALDSEGQADLCADARGMVLPVPAAGRERADDSPFGPGGWRARPDVAAAAARLRWVAAHRGEARAMGAAAAEWVRRHRDIRACAPALVEAMEQGRRGAAPLAPRVALWVPSLGRRCGIAEYAADLAAQLPGAVPGADARGMAGRTHLHLEHEFGIVGSEAVVRAMRLARGLGLRASVTMHTVAAAAAPFEREADALVALTRRGAERLAARNPGIECAHVPLGCHTWFPPRKARAGRVVGAFGFLAPHKGFEALVAAVRAMPGTSLLLFSHAHDPAAGAAFDAAAHGVAMRRVDEYLPVAEVARRLAAECDVLAFWYRDIGAGGGPAYASAAVAAGLATGVPVLASRAACFDDLGEAVLRADGLEEGIGTLLDDRALAGRTAEAALDYCHANDWPTTARRHRALWARIR
jgi:glycosyltransferase involved in cell wall biosynthesis